MDLAIVQLPGSTKFVLNKESLCFDGSEWFTQVTKLPQYSQFTNCLSKSQLNKYAPLERISPHCLLSTYIHLERALCKIWQVCVGVNFLLFQISRFLMVLGGQDCAKSDKLKLRTYNESHNSGRDPYCAKIWVNSNSFILLFKKFGSQK